MKQKRLVSWHLGAYTAVLIGFFLRVYHLNDVAVEKAEMMSIVWFIRDGLSAVLTENKDLNNHPLNSLLGYMLSSGKESLFTLRWHSVVIGVITVAVVIRLVKEWFGRRDGLVAGVLISISAYHVSLSQRSRGYVGLVGFAVLSLYFAWRAVQTNRKRYWVGFVAASVLSIYAHLYGAMAIGVVGLTVLIFLIGQRSPRQLLSKNIFPTLSPLVASLVAIYLISLGLYWPMLADTVSVAGQNNQFRESDVRRAEDYEGFRIISQPVYEAIRPFSLAKDETRLRLGDPTFHYGPFDEVAALAQGKVGFYLSVGSFLLGLAVTWRKFRGKTSVLIAWLVLPFILQGVGVLVLPGAYFRGRFLGFIYTPYLILMARGWPGLADQLGERVSGHPYLKRLSNAVAWLGVGALVLFNLAWLGTFYSAAIGEHWNDVAQRILQNIQVHDMIICGQRPKTACTFDLSVRTRRDVQELDELITFENMRADRAHLEQPGRVWVVMPHSTGWQVASLKDQTNLDNYWLMGDPKYDQAALLLIDSQGTLGDNLVAALQLGAGIGLDTQEKYRDYISLAQIQLARDQLRAAEESFDLAAELLPDEEGSRQQFGAVAEQLEYARQAHRPIEDLPQTAVPVNLDFEGMARLVAYEIDRQIISPGEELQVRLYWQALARMDQSFVSFVHLTDREATLVGEATNVPSAGEAPTTSWRPGQIIVDAYTVVVDPAAQAPFVMGIGAGLFDPQNYRFVQAVDNTGQPVNSRVAEIKVIPPVWPVDSPLYSTRADFGGLIRLVGYDLVVDPPGIVFYWQGQKAMHEDYTVFVHLLDADGKLAAQMDGQPLQGRYPTSWWSPDERIVDRHSGPSIPPGKYQLLVGWYRLSDGSRLLLADGSGDSLSLGTINVP